MGNKFDFNERVRLTGDPELIFAEGSGTPRVRLRVASDDLRRGYDGKWEVTQTVFHNVVAFGKEAEAIAGLYAKGDAVVVSGDLRATVRDIDGRETTDWEVHARTVSPDVMRSKVTIDRSRGVPVNDQAPASVGQDRTAQTAPKAERTVSQ